jgi:murein DD-endopeptidase MepM/ murein hydrolase activator NlpD
MEERSRRAHDGVRLQLSTSACDHAFPICGDLNSDFGPRRGRMHYGVDIDLDPGDPVVAAFEGVVRISRRHKTFGNVVVIRHWNGLETLYGHLSQLNVTAGQSVAAGDTIGLGGSTGRSTGPHLHFETRYLGNPIDPKFIFDLSSGELKNTSLVMNHGVYEAASSTRSYHIVRRGDTLTGIAARQGTTVRELCRLNGLSTRSTLRIGQRVRTR